MLFIILIQALLILHLKGTDGQEIVFDLMKPVSPCIKGLIADTDNFTFTGTVGKNFSELIRLNWTASITVQILVSSSQKKVCDINFGVDGFFCNSSSTIDCHCDHQNTTTGSVHFVINRPARLDYSQGQIRAQWQHRNGSVYYSPSTAPLPVIYDVKKAKLVLQVNGAVAEPISAPTGVHFTSKQNNSVQLCCSNTASPCYTTISFNGQVVGSQANCVNYTVFARDVNYTATVTSSYSVCNQSEIIPVGSSVITTVEKGESSPTIEPTTAVNSTTDEATTSSTSPATVTEKQKSDDDNTLTICLAVIIPCVVLIAAGVGLYCYCKKKSNKKTVSTNHSTPSVEGDKKTSQLSGESNKAFDEGEASLSNIAINGVNANTPDNSQQDPTVKENGSNKQFTGKSNDTNDGSASKTNDGSASKNMPGEPRKLPPLKGTVTHGHLQAPVGSRPASVEVTSSPAGKATN